MQNEGSDSRHLILSVRTVCFTCFRLNEIFILFFCNLYRLPFMRVHHTVGLKKAKTLFLHFSPAFYITSIDTVVKGFFEIRTIDEVTALPMTARHIRQKGQN